MSSTSTPTTTTRTAATNNPTKNNLSLEKIQRAKELAYALSGKKDATILPVAETYHKCKSLTNLIESVARDFETKPSQLDKIDLRTGKVFRRREKGEKVSVDTRRRARSSRQDRSSRR